MPDEKVVRMRAGSPEMPQAAEAERNLLGALLIDGAALPIIAAIVQPDDFYIEAHRLVYQAARDIYESGEAVDIYTLTETLRQRNQLGVIGGSPELSSMASHVPSSINYATYAKIVAKSADRRRLVALWQRHAMLGYDEQTPPLDAITQVQESLTGVSERIFSRAGEQGKTLISAVDLLNMEIPEPRLVVAGLIPEGLTILGGRPKMGKSWLSLNLGLAVAAGHAALGYTSTEQGDVLYLALEDTPARLRNRIEQCLGEQPAPAALDFALKCPRLDEGGLLFIENWVRHKTAPRMVIVDTLAMVRPTTNDGEHANLYAQDYAAMSGLKQLADKHHIAVVVVHHLRKSGSMSDDPIEELSGTNGISGAADNILVLKRPRGQTEGTLTAAGRDIEDTELAMRFDLMTGCWAVIGQGAEVRITRERQEVIDLLRESSEPMTPGELAALLGKPSVSVRRLLHYMQSSLMIARVGRGKYKAL